MTSRTELRDWLGPYTQDVPDETADKLLIYIELLEKWNKRIALTSLSKPIEIAQTLIGESISGLGMIPNGASRLADVGSGAGIPGLILKAFLPGAEVFLIEPSLKKSVFLIEAGRAMGFEGLAVIRDRVGGAGGIKIPQLDCVTSRALGDRDSILSFSEASLRPGGKILLWIGMDQVAAQRKHEGWLWQEPVTLPNTEKRCIVVGEIRS
jgi:16S rRNA (guanine527-N7)-methyltransferase